MASAEKLLADAEYAFRNISPGSTDEKKYEARAKRYASKLLAKYPLSNEAEQARNILRHLGVGFATPKRTSIAQRPLSKSPVSRGPTSKSPHANHTTEAPHLHTAEQRKVIADVLAPRREHKSRGTADDSWQNIWRTFVGLSDTKKKILAFLSLFLIAIVGFTPFLLVFFLYYAAQPAKIRHHVHSVVTYFA